MFIKHNYRYLGPISEHEVESSASCRLIRSQKRGRALVGSYASWVRGVASRSACESDVTGGAGRKGPMRNVLLS